MVNLDTIKENFLLIILVVFTLFAIVGSYIKYVVRLDYNLVVRIECLSDIASDNCITDGEDEYLKVLVYARDMNLHCKTGEEKCIVDMVQSKNAEVLECESSIDTDEVCVING